ncbi:hypothetical protein, partial [Escherichia coli]|uniref:hypothetical protein n=1 Tax=Escherichia coli TaxID=562 RepID=UPI001BC83B62
MTKSARDCHIEYQQGENINHRNAAENGVTQPKSGSFRATHGKEMKWSTKTGHRVRVFSSID